MQRANIVFAARISSRTSISYFFLYSRLQPHILLVSQSQILNSEIAMIRNSSSKFDECDLLWCIQWRVRYWLLVRDLAVHRRWLAQRRDPAVSNRLELFSHRYHSQCWAIILPASISTRLGAICRRSKPPNLSWWIDPTPNWRSTCHRPAETSINWHSDSIIQFWVIEPGFTWTMTKWRGPISARRRNPLNCLVRKEKLAAHGRVIGFKLGVNTK